MRTFFRPLHRRHLEANHTPSPGGPPPTLGSAGTARNPVPDLLNTPARTRTWDPRLRRPMLYPAELRALAGRGIRWIRCRPDAKTRPSREPGQPHRANSVSSSSRMGSAYTHKVRGRPPATAPSNSNSTRSTPERDRNSSAWVPCPPTRPDLGRAAPRKCAEPGRQEGKLVDRKENRGAGIRTRDLLLPKQARYRAAPRPVLAKIVIGTAVE